MDPIATITSYYRILDTNSQKIIEETMKEVGNYREFIIKLGSKLEEGLSSPSLLFFTVRHAYNLSLFDIIDRIVSENEEYRLIIPWVIASKRWREGENVLEEVLSNSDTLLAEVEEDWKIVELLFLRALVLFMDRLYERSITEARKGLDRIQQNSELKFLEANFHWVISISYLNRGELESALKSANSALQITQVCNDIFMEARVLSTLGGIKKNSDTSEAVDLFNRASEIFSELGSIDNEAQVMNSLGLVHTIMGKLNLAHEYFEKAYATFTSIGMQSEAITANLAQSYISLNQCQKAIDILTSIKPSIVKRNYVLHFYLAEALICKGQLDQAADHIDSGFELVVDSPYKTALLWYYSSRGLLERERGEINTSLSSFKRALNIAEEQQIAYHITRILSRYIETLALLFFETKEFAYFVQALTLLSRLGQYSREQGLLGVLTRIEILKGTLRLFRGQKDIAKDHLKRAIGLTQESGLDHLTGDILLIKKAIEEEDIPPELVGTFRKQINSIAVPSFKMKDIPYTVLGIIVLLRNGGLTLFSKYVSDRIISDPAIVAALITAVSAFTEDLQEDTHGELQSILHQDIAVLLEHGEYTTCALLCNRDTYDARKLQRRFLDIFEEKHEDILTGFDGQITSFRDGDDIFKEVFGHNLEDRYT